MTKTLAVAALVLSLGSSAPQFPSLTQSLENTCASLQVQTTHPGLLIDTAGGFTLQCGDKRFLASWSEIK